MTPQRDSVTMNDMSQYIGTAEAAKVVGCSVRTIVRAAQAGHLPYAIKMAGDTGAYLFTVEAVEAFARERAA